MLGRNLAESASSPLYLDGTVYSSKPTGMITYDGFLNTNQMIPGQNYWFYAHYTDPNGCSNVDSFQASTIILLDPVADPVGPFCANDNTKIQLTGTPSRRNLVWKRNPNRHICPFNGWRRDTHHRLHNRNS